MPGARVVTIFREIRAVEVTGLLQKGLLLFLQVWHAFEPVAADLRVEEVSRLLRLPFLMVGAGLRLLRQQPLTVFLLIGEAQPDAAGSADGEEHRAEHGGGP